ncbi:MULTISPECIES: formyltransferase family protein [Leptospira]|uniref:formyltransferase family protein n=1 Tax=Leptospira TaxID=171 RepID=UPI0002928C09|nr:MULTISPECIES: formyltransferase family protein [Leptospira]EKO78319.1 formyl transferase domain protein [Leptospira sp. Fiocruz LV3954]EMO15104.1 formyl transferase domain protein [Leptospira santarosai str. CBC523]EMO84940.1 formyl transferase domain protein [Leptospira santarosai str. AIM]EKS07813.1 formyl transferase domain protein [Leptospira santarosai str. JET]EMI69118.1 formyl transferase domain protein [Leptospira sp. Fiocruz LV4135]
MKKIVILASDTPHRRYYIKRILAEGIPILAVVFESTSIKPNFPVAPFFSQEEAEFEKENFFSEFDDNLDEIQVKVVENINDNSCLAFLESLSADFGIVFGTRKVKPSIIEQFKDGAINVHRGIAEEYRGLDTNLWAIYHSDLENIGVTIHHVGKELDTGDLVLQRKIVYPAGAKIFQLRYYETKLSAELSIQALHNYLMGTLSYRPQRKIGRYYSFMPLVIKELLPLKLEKLLKNYYG